MKCSFLKAGILSLVSSSFLFGATVDFVIAETTDLHANMMNYDYYKDEVVNEYGFVKTASLIKQVRSEYPNLVLVDNGDLIQGSPLADYVVSSGLQDGQTHPIYKLMNELDYTVGNLGNHEFNFGIEFLKKSISTAKFPYINANIYDVKTGENYFTPYIIKDTKVIDSDGNERSLKVGYIGFVPPQIMLWDKANLEGRVFVEDITQTALKFVPKMKEQGADIIVAIPHSGVSSDPYRALAENSVYYLSLIKGIDAIMFGHSHGVFPSSDFKNLPNTNIEQGTINTTAAVMPGFWGSHLGVIKLTLDEVDGKWRVIDSSSKALPIFDAANKQAVVQADKDMILLIEEDHNKTLEFVGKPIGRSNIDINSYLSLIQNTPAIEIINDAQIDYVTKAIQGDPDLQDLEVISAAAPFKAGGRKNEPNGFIDVKNGELSFKNAADIYLYPNVLTYLKITGKDVKEWLECSVGVYNTIDTASSAQQELINWNGFRAYNFDIISGVNYEIDITKHPKYTGNCEPLNPNSQRVYNVTFKGKPIDENQTFIMATNNYRAYTGRFSGTGKNIIADSPDDMRIILTAYIQSETNKNGAVDVKANDNFKILPIQSENELNIIFESSNKEAAREYILQNSIYPMQYLGEDEVGFGVYKIDFK